MIVFNDSVLFVHNPKTAGTSLISYLTSTLPAPVHTAGVEQLGTYHPSLSMAMGYASGIRGHTRFDQIISVLRDPFDREVSMYIYFREVLAGSPSLRTNLPDVAMQRRVYKSAELGFRDYLKWLWTEEGTVDVWRSRCFYETAEGVAIDQLRLVRFEQLEADLALVLNVPNVQLPMLNASSRNQTAHYYDEETVEIVRQSYEWMFDAGYYSPSLPQSV